MHQITPVFQNLSCVQASAKLTICLHTISKQEVETFLLSLLLVIILSSVSLSPPNKPTGGVLTLVELPTHPGWFISLSLLYKKRRE